MSRTSCGSRGLASRTSAPWPKAGRGRGSANQYYLAAKVNLSDSLGPVPTTSGSRDTNLRRRPARSPDPAGEVAGADPAGQVVYTFTYWTTIVPCEEVWASGVVHPHWISG